MPTNSSILPHASLDSTTPNSTTKLNEAVKLRRVVEVFGIDLSGFLDLEVVSGDTPMERWLKEGEVLRGRMVGSAERCKL